MGRNVCQLETNKKRRDAINVRHENNINEGAIFTLHIFSLILHLIFSFIALGSASHAAQKFINDQNDS